MNPFFFGKSENPLYGVYQAPQIDTPKTKAILLCSPFGQEYMRSHRAYRQLALLLSKKGHHVLRFDYRGCGDSSGEIEEVSVADWMEDINTAIDELKEMADLDQVILVGLRLGALLAGEISSQRDDIESLVIWDPILSGADYEAELLERISREDSPPCNMVDAQENLYFNGFPLSKSIRAELRDMSFQQMTIKAKNTLEVVSHVNDHFLAIKEIFQSTPNFRWIHAPSPGDWNYVDDFGGILLPQPVIKAIVEWIS